MLLELLRYEFSAFDYLNSYSPPSWLASYPAERFAHIVYAQPSAGKMVSDMSLAIARKAGYVYVTADVFSNPYDKLSSYWPREGNAALSLIFADGFDSGTASAW